jgi:hypothetical protein
VWVDYITVNSNNTTSGNTWTRAAVGTVSGGVTSFDGSNRNGFWLEGNASTNYSATITVQLTNVPAKFNWCAYVSDYPPNAVINGNSYTLKGTPPFKVNGTLLGTNITSYSGNCITSITDATDCPGLFPTPTTTSLSANPTSICYGSSAVLTASASGAASYSFDNGSSWQTTTTKTVNPTTTTNYILKVRSATGCTSTDSKTVTVTVNRPSDRDVATSSCGCASGLTAVGGYCRNLSADGASTYTGCGFEFVEVTSSGSRDNCAARCTVKGGGWVLATCDQYKCLHAAGKLATTWYYSSGSYQAYKTNPTCNSLCPGCSTGCSVNCYHSGIGGVCVR